METVCAKCGATWSPDLSPEVELVLCDANGETIIAMGPPHECGRVREWWS